VLKMHTIYKADEIMLHYLALCCIIWLFASIC